MLLLSERSGESATVLVNFYTLLLWWHLLLPERRSSLQLAMLAGGTVALRLLLFVVDVRVFFPRWQLSAALRIEYCCRREVARCVGLWERQLSTYVRVSARRLGNRWRLTVAPAVRLFDDDDVNIRRRRRRPGRLLYVENLYAEPHVSETSSPLLPACPSARVCPCGCLHTPRVLV